MQILDLCDRVVVISFGQKICEGLPEEVREQDRVFATAARMTLEQPEEQ